MRHDCTTDGEWAHCTVCNGRIHKEGCTTRRKKQIDCCPQRHKMLHEQGHVRGLADDSYLMWTPGHPYGLHAPVKRTVLVVEGEEDK